MTENLKSGDLTVNLPDKDPVHYSYSQMMSYLGCHRQWYYRYRRKIPSPINAPMAFGSCMHKVIEENSRVKMLGGRDIPLSDLMEVFRHDWVTRRDTTTFTTQEEFDELGEYGESMVKKIYPTLKEMRPKKIEFSTSRLLPDKNFGVYGYVDMEDEDGKISDFKTAGRTPSLDKETGKFKVSPSHQFQLTLYAYAQAGIVNEVKTSIYYLIKNKEPEIREAPFIVTKEMILSFIRRTDMIVRAIRSDNIFLPNREQFTMCGGCSFRKICFEEC